MKAEILLARPADRVGRAAGPVPGDAAHHVAARAERSLNFEVLLRMRDAAGQSVPTPRLITAAENSGRMGMIDRWVLRQTLAWCASNRTPIAPRASSA